MIQKGTKDNAHSPASVVISLRGLSLPLLRVDCDHARTMAFATVAR